jgi:hypothetical protein
MTSSLGRRGQGAFLRASRRRLSFGLHGPAQAVTTEDPIATLANALDQVEPLHARLVALAQEGPTAGSSALTDQAVDQLGELVRAHAVVALTNGLDHLYAWARLFRAGDAPSDAPPDPNRLYVLLPTFAHMTLLRSTVEGTATARWLVEASVDPRVRIARGIGAQLDDLRERGKIEALPKPPGAPASAAGSTFRPASVRIQNLENRAAAAGLCPLRIGRTDVAARFGPGEGLYRMLCAFAHGGMAIPLSSSQGQAGDADVGGLRPIRVEANADHAADMTYLAVRGAQRSLSEVLAYHGRS